VVEVAAKVKSELVGRLETALPRVFEKESGPANLAADATLAAGKMLNPKTSLAFFNAGGVRAGLPAGMVNYGQLFETYPFDNRVVVIRMNGSEVRTMAEILYSGGFGAPGIAGGRVKIREQGIPRDLDGNGTQEFWETNRLVDLVDGNGKSITPDETRFVATMDFLSTGGDHLDFVFDRIPRDHFQSRYGLWVRDAVRDFIKARKVLKATAVLDPARPRIEILRQP
jgi:2',3'-cyclic-nucleotide 2'-phosphodiesterase (5'-nucleotidase family)